MRLDTKHMEAFYTLTDLGVSNVKFIALETCDMAAKKRFGKKARWTEAQLTDSQNETMYLIEGIVSNQGRRCLVKALVYPALDGFVQIESGGETVRYSFIDLFRD